MSKTRLVGLVVIAVCLSLTCNRSGGQIILSDGQKKATATDCSDIPHLFHIKNLDRNVPPPLSCCHEGTNTYFTTVESSGVRRLGLGSYANVPTPTPCTLQDGKNTNCNGRDCYYGPCGSSSPTWLIAAKEVYVFRSSNPDKCGWEARNVLSCQRGKCPSPNDPINEPYRIYSPEPFNDQFPQVQYPGVTPTCPYAACQGGPVPWPVPPGPPPMKVWDDDFETDKGWMTNPTGADTAAAAGKWERGAPQATTSGGRPMQLGTTVSGVNDLVTGRLAGPTVDAYDIDGGVTSIMSPAIILQGGTTITLTFYYYLAHLNDSSTDDFFQVSIVDGASKTPVFHDSGAAFQRDAAWGPATVDLSQFAEKTIRILIEAADAGGASLVEAGVDDVKIIATKP
jgi:hypothetical protein